MLPTRCGANWCTGPARIGRDAASWRSHGDDPLPSGLEAFDEPFSAFPSWFMRITSNSRGDMLIRDIPNHAQHIREAGAWRCPKSFWHDILVSPRR